MSALLQDVLYVHTVQPRALKVLKKKKNPFIELNPIKTLMKVRIICHIIQTHPFMHHHLITKSDFLLRLFILTKKI